VLAVRASSGFSLIELVIAVAIAALLFVLAVPSFSAWLQNQQIRNAAEAVLNGMQLARGEAIRRNLAVQFNLVVLPQLAWQVSEVVSTTQIQAWSGAEGAASAQVAPTPAGSAVVTFDGLGRVRNNADGTAPLTQVDVSSAVVTSAEIRPMRVSIGTGGSVRMCDPQLNFATDPRGC
jgi:type IV fimbrial biogenesis protein FimT